MNFNYRSGLDSLKAHFHFKNIYIIIIVSSTIKSKASSSTDLTLINLPIYTISILEQDSSKLVINEKAFN